MTSEQPATPTAPDAGPVREVQLYGASYSLSDDETRASFEEEDERWSTSAQLWDWVKLLVAMLLWAVWTLIVYFLEPGLR